MPVPAGSKVDIQEVIAALHEWSELLEAGEDAAILLHYVGAAEPVANWRMDRDTDRIALGGRIAAKMEQFARGMKALCKFMLVARHGKSEIALGSLPFTVEQGLFAGVVGAERSYELSEGPTAAGRDSQLMRFANEDHRIRLAGSMDVMGFYQRALERAESTIQARDMTIERLTREIEGHIRAWQEAEDRKADRDLRVDQIRRELEAKDRNAAAFWMIAPLIAMKFLPPDMRQLAVPLIRALQENFSRPPAPAMPAMPANQNHAAVGPGANARGATATPAPAQAAASTQAAPAPATAPAHGGTPVEMFLATLRSDQRTKLLSHLSISQQQQFFDIEKSPTTASVKTFVEGLDGLEQLMSLAGDLTEEQQALLMMVVNEVVEEPADAKAAE